MQEHFDDDDILALAHEDPLVSISVLVGKVKHPDSRLYGYRLISPWEANQVLRGQKHVDVEWYIDHELDEAWQRLRPLIRSEILGRLR